MFNLTECVYIVRFIELINSPGRRPWSLQHYAIYHRWSGDRKAPYSTWMLFGSSQRTEKCFDDYLRGVKNPLEANPFELHIMPHETAITSWRTYFIYLHDRVVEFVICTPSMYMTKLTSRP
jgi:hypothetical protein